MPTAFIINTIAQAVRCPHVTMEILAKFRQYHVGSEVNKVLQFSPVGQ